MPAPVPANEAVRLASLHAAAILDTPSEPGFNDLVALAAHICQTPISTVTFVDAHRQWFKARVGLDVSETPRDISFCAHTILEDAALIVPDAKADERFASQSNVVAAPGIRFYAGSPLRDRDGLALGSLCVIDRTPRTLTADQLQALSRRAEAQLELRRVLGELADAVRHIKRLEGLVPMCAWCRRIRNDDQYWGSVEQYIADRSDAVVSHGICEECAAKASNESASNRPSPVEQRRRWTEKWW
jgi:GAF domain-containing protein